MRSPGSILETMYYSSEHRGARVPFGRFYRVFYWALHRVCMGVCTENSVLIDYVTEPPNVTGDDRSVMLLPDPVRLAVQVEEPT